MALITCPKCGNQVSDKAEKCPKCGWIVEEIQGKKNISFTNISHEINNPQIHKILKAFTSSAYKKAQYTFTILSITSLVFAFISFMRYIYVLHKEFIASTASMFFSCTLLICGVIFLIAAFIANIKNDELNSLKNIEHILEIQEKDVQK